MKREVPIWDRFIRAYPNFAESVDYDCICGKGPEVPENMGQPWKDDAKYLGSWKIDAVAFQSDNTYVIEVRPRAGLSAIGEVFMKMLMYRREHPDATNPEPVLITDQERPDMRELTAEHDIAFFVV